MKFAGGFALRETVLVRDIVERIERIGAPYAIGGSVASSTWGTPRSTHDVDIVIVLSPEEIGKVVKEFPNPYYVSEDAIHLALNGGMFNIIQTIEDFKADFWVPAAGDEFNQSVLARRQHVEIPPGFMAWLASPEDVLLHKLVWHKMTPSDKQLMDCGGIAAVQSGRLDLEYLRAWAARQGTSDSLNDVLAGKGLKAT
jgi:hypothetical protein